MKNMLLIFFIWATTHLAFTTQAYSQLTISGEIRPRAEYRHGYQSLVLQNEDAAFFVEQRSRLNVNFESNDVQVFLSLQDIRVWGNQPQLVSNDGAFTSIHQAWAKVKLHPKWKAKFGRQEIIYDDHRIFGNVGWAQQARSHDAAILIFQDSTFQAQFGLAFNQDRPQLTTTLYTVPNNYKTIQFLWLHKEWKALKGSFLFLNNGMQVIPSNSEASTNFSQTIGGRISWKASKVVVNLATYYQAGTDSDTLNTKINAYYASADFTYAISKLFSLKTGIEILSGNDPLNNNNENNAFNPFYGTNHKFNGLMDYFYVGNHARNVGLNDLFLGAYFRKKRLKAGLVSHFFLTNTQLLSTINSPMDKYLGTELDFTLDLNLTESTNLKFGYSQLFGTETMEVLKGGNRNETTNWIWAMVTVQPSFTFN